MQYVCVIHVTTVQLQLNENMYPLLCHLSKYVSESRFSQPLTAIARAPS